MADGATTLDLDAIRHLLDGHPGCCVDLPAATVRLLIALGEARAEVDRLRDATRWPPNGDAAWRELRADHIRLLAGRDEARAEADRLRALTEGGDTRASVAEEIARAIELNDGRRCPECGGKAASLKWRRGTLKRDGRCGAGHTWTADHAKGQWRDYAEIAREHAAPTAMPVDGGTGDGADHG